MDTAMAEIDAFAAARGCFEEMLGWLEGTESAQMPHAELEEDWCAVVVRCSAWRSRTTSTCAHFVSGAFTSSTPTASPMRPWRLATPAGSRRWWVP